MRISGKTTEILDALKKDADRFLNRGSLSDIYNRDGSYVNEFLLYSRYFERIPNITHLIDADCENAIKWFCKTYREKIREYFFTKIFLKEKKKIMVDDVFVIMNDDIIIQFDTNQYRIRFLFKTTPIAIIEGFVTELKRFRKVVKRNSPKISLLYKTNYGLDIKTIEIKKPKLNIADNYNNDFLAVHHTITNRLKKSCDKGLVLLHGLPGTGKTSYIRYLSAIIPKKFIFLPVTIAKQIAGPELVSLLVDNANSVLVIEDAESLIIDRMTNNNSSVSTLLNICDGLLSDCLNIQIICSFNTDISKIDKALTRKGRLIAHYEFKELTIQKAQLLSDKLGYINNINQPVALSDIYNMGQVGYQQKMKVIGF